MSSLGTVVSPWTQEQFPILGSLTIKQVSKLFMFEKPNITAMEGFRRHYQITDSGIVEVAVRFSDRRPGRIWLNADGEVVATAFAEHGKDSETHWPWTAWVHPPSDRFFSKGVEFHYKEGEFSLGNRGCVPAVRQMLIDLWDEEG